MSEQEAVRRLVKSGPELWAQCSDPLALSKHLAAFGEITITRLEPESTVAWEGESARGTVSLEPSGWGTRVRLTAQGPAPEPAPVHPFDVEPDDEVGATPVAVTEPLPLTLTAQPRRLSALMSALFGRRRAAVASQPPPAPAPVVAPPAVPVAIEPAALVEVTDNTTPVTESPDLVAELEAALDSLGAAHHRPYSRS